MTEFTQKLNKKQSGIYVVEETVTTSNGIYEGVLKHDNINDNTVTVYSGTKLTGVKIQSFVLSTPSETPWKRIIKIFADIEKLYVTYETQGDTVEAEDINVIQDAINNLEMELEAHKDDLNCHIENREIDGGSFV